MNAGASPTGQAFAARNCDALFCMPSGAETVTELENGIQLAKELATGEGREIDVFSVGVITCRPTDAEAGEYHHHCIVEAADWSAVDNILAMRDVRPENVGTEAFQRRRNHLAHGMGGIPIVGSPDTVAEGIAAIAAAGLRGIGVSFVNYLEELSYFLDEVLPRLERMGLHEARLH